MFSLRIVKNIHISVLPAQHFFRQIWLHSQKAGNHQKHCGAQLIKCRKLLAFSFFSYCNSIQLSFFENLIWLKNCGSTDTHICIHYSNEYIHTICIAELFNLKNEMRLRELRRASYLLSTLIQSPYGASEKRSFLQ